MLGILEYVINIRTRASESPYLLVDAVEVEE